MAIQQGYATYHEGQDGWGRWKRITGGDAVDFEHTEEIGFIPEPYQEWPGEVPVIYLVDIEVTQVSVTGYPLAGRVVKAVPLNLGR